MKKGFTLIELLAVIVILAVILVIAIPQVLKVVDNSRINAYIKNEQMVLKAVDVYVSRNTGSLPGEIGSTTEVSINYLVSNGMLTEIKNPYNKTEDCTGYVTITKLSDTKYDYTPHLRCGLDIHDSSGDGLVAHYKFDDFQEPTENLLLNPSFGKGTTENWTSSGTGGIMSLGKISNYSFDLISEEGSSNILRNNIKLLPGEYYMRVWYESIEGQVPYFHYSSSVNEASVNVIVDFQEKEGLQIAESKIEIYEEFYSPNIRFSSNAPADRMEGNVRIHGVQVEQKLYPTPFVKGIREGGVKDFSVNNNHAPLQLETTPRWTFDIERNSGVYFFDGIKTYIDLGQIISSGPKTFALWIKPTKNTYSNFTRILQVGNQEGYGVALRITNNKFEFLFSEVNNTNIVFEQTIVKDKWYHVVGIYDGEKKEIYVNGIKGNESRVSGEISATGKNVNLGRRVNSNHDHFNGAIDDVRIYNRALSELEVKLLYESTK